MKSEPVWHAARPKLATKIKNSARYDVAVVGGGITGVSTAYLLKQAGKKVCLLERDRLASGDTSLTTAHLTNVTDTRISELAKNFGDDGAALVWEAGAAAIDMIESIVKHHEIDSDFRRVPGYLSAPLFGNENDDAKEIESLMKDAETAKRLGFPAVFVEAVPHFKRPGIRFPDQAKFHPLKYLATLIELIQGDGSDVFDRSEVDTFEPDPQRLHIGDFVVEADYVVIATHVPLTGNTGLAKATAFQTKIFPYSSYVIGAKLPRGTLPEASYWDTADPYYYLRVERHERNDYVIFGGEDHKTGQAADTEVCFAKLERALVAILPEAKPDRRWSGQVIETNDGLPYIGESAPQQFIATGFSGNGMTFGTVAAMMAHDAIVGRSNPWSKLFAVERKKLRGGLWDYLVENVDFPYYYVKDRLSRAEGDSTRSVKRGDGKILDLHGERIACSRDDNGKLCETSAYCTHMGCIVRWNGGEKTWDCPCHGSRFKPTGEVIAGPAETPLEPAKAKPKPKAARSNDDR